MTIEEMEALFEMFDDEFGQFKLIESPAHRLRDLCAFMMLDAVLPGNYRAVAAAEHDKIFLEADIDGLARVATNGLIRDLVRCGVMLDIENHSLAMFA